MTVMQRENAIAQIGALIQQWQIQPSELSGFYAAAAPAKPSAALIPEVIAYLGGLLMITGIAVFIGIQWEYFNTAARIVVTLGTGTVVLAIGLIAAAQNTWVKARNVIFPLAASLQATGILVALHEFYPNSDDAYVAGIVTSGLMLLTQLGVLSRFKDRCIVFLALCFGYALFWMILGKLSVHYSVINIAGSVSMLILARYFQGQAAPKLTTALYFIGSGIFLSATFDWLRSTPFEIAYFGLAVGAVYASAMLRSTAVLINGSIAVLGFLSYFTAQHFADVVGWPIALIGLGALFLTGGNMAWKIQRRYIKPAAN